MVISFEMMCIGVRSGLHQFRLGGGVVYLVVYLPTYLHCCFTSVEPRHSTLLYYIEVHNNGNPTHRVQPE